MNNAVYHKQCIHTGRGVGIFALKKTPFNPLPKARTNAIAAHKKSWKLEFRLHSVFRTLVARKIMQIAVVTRYSTNDKKHTFREHHGISEGIWSVFESVRHVLSAHAEALGDWPPTKSGPERTVYTALARRRCACTTLWVDWGLPS